MTYLRPGRITFLAFLLSLVFLGCASMRPATSLQAARLFGPDPVPGWAQSQEDPDVAPIETGMASFYGPGFHGKATASGETYDQEKMTAAHPTLEFGSRVRVTNLANGASVVVRVTDRGPYVRGRVIDLSVRAARALQFVKRGVTRVRLEPVS